MDCLLLRKRFKVCQDLLNKGVQGDLVIPCHSLQFAHIQQGLDHLAQALVLLGHHTDGLLRTGIVGRMLGRVVQVQLQLHHSQRSAELVCRIRRELPLHFKRLGQARQHPVVGNTQPAQLGDAAFLNVGVRQVLRLHLLDFIGKFAERLQGASAYKIGGNAAGKRHQRREQQAVLFVICLVVVDLHRKIADKIIPRIIGDADVNFGRGGIAAVAQLRVHRMLQRVNIVNAVAVDKQRKAAANHRNAQGGDQGQPPLQG